MADWFRFYTFGWGAGFTIYLLVQVAAAAVTRRALVLLPAPVMLAFCVLTAGAYNSDSNLWPIVLIFSSPVAIVAVLVLWALSWAIYGGRPREPRRQGSGTGEGHSEVPTDE